MLLALAASQAVGAVIAWSDRGHVLKSAMKSEFLSRAASVAKLLETTPRDVQGEILGASGTNFKRFWITPAAPDASRW